MADGTAGRGPGNKPEHLIVGQIVAPFGVKGELKVNILTDFPERFQKLKEIILSPFESIEPGLAPRAALDPRTVRSAPGAAVSRVPGPRRKGPPANTSFGVEASQVHKGQLILKLREVDSLEDAEVLRGYWLLVPTEKAGRLPRDAYYLYQIVGMEVVTSAGEAIGTVADIITTAANDVYVVRGPGVNDPTGELLVPAIKMVVKEVDTEQGRMTIAPLEEWT